MKKGSKFSLFVLLLLLGSYLMTLGSALPIASTAASDITKNISIIGSKIIDNKGVEKSTENPILIISMTEDVKGRGGSGYVVEKDKMVLEEWFRNN